MEQITWVTSQIADVSPGHVQSSALCWLLLPGEVSGAKLSWASLGAEWGGSTRDLCSRAARSWAAPLTTCHISQPLGSWWEPQQSPGSCWGWTCHPEGMKAVQLGLLMANICPAALAVPHRALEDIQLLSGGQTELFPLPQWIFTDGAIRHQSGAYKICTWSEMTLRLKNFMVFFFPPGEP